MDITAILCTYNRSQSLTKALQSAALLKMPKFVNWEILVVDNNSTDDTRAVTESSAAGIRGASDMLSNLARGNRAR